MYDTVASASRYFGPGLGTFETSFAWRRREKRAAGQGQPVVFERGVLESADWGTVAGPAAGLWGLEEHPSPLLSLAGPRRLGQQLLDRVIDDPDFEWLMIDATHIKVHPHGTGARGGNQDVGRTKGG